MRLARKLLSSMAGLRNRSPKFWVFQIIGLFVLALAFIAENPLEEKAGHSGALERTVYKVLSAPGYRRPRAHYVSIVTIQEGEDPPVVLTDRCARREYITHILRALQNQDAAVVVLDFSPDPPGHCPTETDQDVRSAISALSRTTPIVVGEGSLDIQHLLPVDSAALKTLHPHENDLVLKDPDWIPHDLNPGAARYGLTRTIFDDRSVPITLSAWKRTKGGFAKVVIDSLSVASVKAFQPSAPELQAAAQHSTPPLTAFMGDDAFPRVSGASIVCRSKQLLTDWRQCLPTDAQQVELRHRVVVVALGRNSERADYLSTVLGDVPGYVLQANYIEALLDDRLLWQLPKWLQFGLMLIVYLGVQMAFTAEGRPFRGLIYAFSFLSALFMLALISATMRGWYFDFWLPGLTGTGVVFLERASEWLRRERTVPTSNSPL
jgi:CHASE2 domain-containing sensor protein